MIRQFRRGTYSFAAHCQLKRVMTPFARDETWGELPFNYIEILRTLCNNVL